MASRIPVGGDEEESNKRAGQHSSGMHSWWCSTAPPNTQKHPEEKKRQGEKRTLAQAHCRTPHSPVSVAAAFRGIAGIQAITS
jgi:hypothetical protein